MFDDYFPEMSFVGCKVVVDGIDRTRYDVILKDFVRGAKNILAGKISSKNCRKWAVSQYSTTAVAPRYHKFFDRLEDMWKGGWGELE